MSDINPVLGTSLDSRANARSGESTNTLHCQWWRTKTITSLNSRATSASCNRPGIGWNSDRLPHRSIDLAKKWAVGPTSHESGKLIPIDIKVGDRVLFGKWSGTEVKIDGEELLPLIWTMVPLPDDAMVSLPGLALA